MEWVQKYPSIILRVVNWRCWPSVSGRLPERAGRHALPRTADVEHCRRLPTDWSTNHLASHITARLLFFLDQSVTIYPQCIMDLILSNTANISSWVLRLKMKGVACWNVSLDPHWVVLFRIVKRLWNKVDSVYIQATEMLHYIWLCDFAGSELQILGLHFQHVGYIARPMNSIS